jgi:transcription elongation GreA/GreB family factor/very-short-patch-repair endonuclease
MILGNSGTAAERLNSLLEYVEQVVRLDERAAMRLAEHRLSTGLTFIVHQHEPAALPGISHDLTDDDGPIWLRIERLRRGAPPVPLKARVIRHFRDPMAGAQAPTGDLEAMCDSDFEREILRRLVGRGYHVTPQVGAVGYRIDLVVEGVSGRRLAVECDGDKYHGPERWVDDMRRQRILERIGWRFWRCWASSFTLDPDGCIDDLIATLDRMEIEPDSSERSAARYTRHIEVIAPKAHTGNSGDDDAGIAGETGNTERLRVVTESRAAREDIAIGDRVVFQYLDDRKQLAVTLTRDRTDFVNGFLSALSPLGAELLGKSEDEEIEIDLEGRSRRVLILKVDRLAMLA